MVGGKDIKLMPILIISYTRLYYIYFPHNNDDDEVLVDYKVNS
jgi:hypothetical protein